MESGVGMTRTARRRFLKDAVREPVTTPGFWIRPVESRQYLLDKGRLYAIDMRHLADVIAGTFVNLKGVTFD